VQFGDHYRRKGDGKLFKVIDHYYGGTDETLLPLNPHRFGAVLKAKDNETVRVLGNENDFVLVQPSGVR
jgi:hypothetical protein